MSKFVRIWMPDEPHSKIHLIWSGHDYTICGYDICGDVLVHRKPPKEISGRRTITCADCLSLIADARDYIEGA